MQFRQKIVGIESSLSLEEAIRFMVNQHYSRYPVYEEDLDHIVGMLHFRDAVKAWLETPDKTILEIVRKPFFVHEAMDINELLTSMKKSKSHLAIVLDEFGQTVGLVAMEDILETIVGDILDEYDVEKPQAQEDVKALLASWVKAGMVEN
jgi:putative hemolysin